MAEPASARRRINLALQGGGVNGAFTWGVLDRLLERDVFEFEGVVGTSAGAVNAVALAGGLAKGGPAGARRLLAEVWSGVAGLAELNPLARAGRGLDANPVLREMLGAQRRLATQFLALFSPYELNPFGFDPLRELLARLIDFRAVREQEIVKLFVNATDVELGRSHIFTEMSMTIDVVMASSCLPMVSRAVEIDGRYYWDGGFSENPPIYPLLYGCETPDTLLVLITPRTDAGEPTTVERIFTRLNQITFTASLRHELRQIQLLEHLRRVGELESGTLERAHLHLIEAEGAATERGWQGGLNFDAALIAELHHRGRAAADAFLEAHLQDVGQRSTIRW